LRTAVQRRWPGEKFRRSPREPDSDTIRFVTNNRALWRSLGKSTARRALVVGASLFASIGAARSDSPFRYIDASAPAAHFSLVVKTPGHLCSGVLIAPDVVVTAAHCLLQLRLAPDEIRLLFADALPRGRRADKGADCRGQKFAVNPLWGTLQMPAALPAFDLAAIKFACQTPPSFQPIDVDFAKIEQLIAQHSSGGVTDDIPLSVVGYGNITAPDTRPGEKREVEKFDPRLKLRIVAVRAPRDFGALASLTLQGESGFICHGDSGGAVFLTDAATGRNVLFGVSSMAGAVKGCVATSFAARIDANYDWLRGAMIEIGAERPVPARSGGASACATTEIVMHADATPLSKEIVTTNACAENIACATIGWTARSSGRPLGFKQDLRLGAFVRHVTQMSTPNLADGGYATALCDKM
jgi:hypothetical protein